jgi:hypothetical protein
VGIKKIRMIVNTRFIGASGNKKGPEKASEVKEKAVKEATEVKDKAVETATKVKDKVTETATAVKEKVVGKTNEPTKK